MRIVQINSVLNVGSTGRIAENIGRAILEAGHQSTIVYGRRAKSSRSESLRVGGILSILSHGMRSYFLGGHGTGSSLATRKLVSQLQRLRPSLIHLHNLHGYYLNYPLLFEYARKESVPVVWTLHDCWAFTGHCAYFDSVGCTKWKSECSKCPLLRSYPKSLVDSSRTNFSTKKRLFTTVPQMQLVCPSNWLAELAEQSFLAKYPVKVIPYGIDTNVFAPVQDCSRERIVLGVANPWSERKGLYDFFQLRSLLPSSFRIVLLGLSRKQLAGLPNGIEGHPPTDNVDALAVWYSRARVFVNPTYADNFPVVNLEALACGCPVVTYRSGGSGEAACSDTGRVVRTGDVKALSDAIVDLDQIDSIQLQNACRNRALNHFASEAQFKAYLDLYQRFISS